MFKKLMCRFGGVVESVKAAALAVVVAVTGFSAAPASAAIDVAAVVTEIEGMAAPIALIGAAILIVFVGIKTWKLIRRAL